MSRPSFYLKWIIHVTTKDGKKDSHWCLLIWWQWVEHILWGLWFNALPSCCYLPFLTLFHGFHEEFTHIKEGNDTKRWTQGSADASNGHSRHPCTPIPSSGTTLVRTHPFLTFNKDVTSTSPCFLFTKHYIAIVNRKYYICTLQKEKVGYWHVI